MYYFKDFNTVHEICIVNEFIYFYTFNYIYDVVYKCLIIIFNRTFVFN